MIGTSPNGTDWDMADALKVQQPLNGSLGSPPTNAGVNPYSERTFIDLFAGAGALSLGLMSSGWRGVFAVERNAMAFKTLSHNLIDGTHGFTYEWPEWFPKEPCTVGKSSRHVSPAIATATWHDHNDRWRSSLPGVLSSWCERQEGLQEFIIQGLHAHRRGSSATLYPA